MRGVRIVGEGELGVEGEGETEGEGGTETEGGRWGGRREGQGGHAPH